jgi:tight adherence protein C
MEALLVFGTLAVGLGLGAAFVGAGRSFVARRPDGTAIAAILEDSPDLHRAELARPFVERFLGPAFGAFQRGARSVTPSWWVERLRRNAALAGLGGLGLEGALALKAVVALGVATIFVAGSAAAGIGVGNVLIWAATGAFVGFFVPDAWLARRAEARQGEIRLMLPEALDLLAIAVGAGMGLEQGIELVARRLPGALGEELHRTLQEVQLGASRREALAHLRERTEVSELSNFALALAQADALGSPLGEVLRIQAVQMRMVRRQRAREQAAKVPVKLLFPLLVCIFPALGVVVIGPAAISILKAFGG